MENDIKVFLSSYGVMTAERILEKYGFNLTHNEIMIALKNKNSFYHHLLRIPFKNILNGIMLEQVHDLHVFGQKLFIDYLLTGESGKDEMQPGGTTRESLEIERKELLNLGEAYKSLQEEQDKTIAESQTFLIDYTKSLQNLKNQSMQQTELEKSTQEAAFHKTLIYKNYLEFAKHYAEVLGSDATKMAETWEEMIALFKMLDIRSEDFMQREKDMASQIITLRKQFYDLILRTRALLVVLPDYTHDEAKERKNKETLDFDSSIGEET